MLEPKYATAKAAVLAVGVLSEIFKLLPTEDRWRAIAVQLWMTLEQMAQIQQSAALQAQDFAFDLF